MVWSVNGRMIETQTFADLFATIGIFVPLPTPNHSVVTVHATPEINGTTFQCLVFMANPFPFTNASEEVQLLVFNNSESKCIPLVVNAIAN